jgi:hypothetical protein
MLFFVARKLVIAVTVFGYSCCFLTAMLSILALPCGRSIRYGRLFISDGFWAY